MVVVDDKTGLVQFVSENIGNYLGNTNRDYVGAELSDLVGADVAHSIANAAARAGAGQIAGVVLKADLGDGRTADITVHRFEGRTFFEFEKPGTPEDTEVALHLTQSLVRRVDKHKEFDALFRGTAKLVRAMLGYDRVMIYRFLHNGAGRVVAEAKDPALGSFLGQHFPVSDIPVQARQLYVRNWVRVIGDVTFVPVPLQPRISDTDTPVDMSFAQLRSVSSIHCEYLRNMGVAASMSISIVVDGKLWGLIACHHNTPKWLSIPLRVATELFAQYFSLHVASIEHREQKAAAVSTRSRLDAIISGVDPNAPVEPALKERLREFMSLIASDGAGLWIRGQWSSSGVTPTVGALPKLMGVIAQKAGRSIWATQDLREVTGDVEEYGSRVAGMLAIPISVSSPDFLVFFRSEEAHEIEWAGEPRKMETLTEKGHRLSPRGSFETWREDVRHKSIPWSDSDFVVADGIRGYVRDMMLSHNDATEEKRGKDEEQRKLLNSELNHRVKNILALVKSIAIQTGTSAATVDEYTAAFEGRLRALSYAHDQSFAGGDGGGLRELIEAEAGMHRFGPVPDRVTISGEPVGLTERAFGVVALLLHEMMTNAAKYGGLSVPSGRLDVAWNIEDNGDCRITWTESGGPEVVAPTRRGFGSKLIEKTVAYDLGGEVEMDFAKEGLRAQINIPAEHLHAVVAQIDVAEDATDVVDEKILQGLSILLVEDQALIAMDTEELLSTLGAASVSIAPSVDAALNSIDLASPDCAVLDLNLGSSSSEIVAARLSDIGIPFVFATGYRDGVHIPDQFKNVPVVRKPVAEKALAVALHRAIMGVSHYSQSLESTTPAST
jgi:light-regulated signal transduction histidine kinase (bacteriophytochrome)/CheY-like chemotaxis protein